MDEAVAYITLKNNKSKPATTEHNWICVTCTLMNIDGMDACEACGTPRTVECEVVFDQPEEVVEEDRKEPSVVKV